ncbi:fungal-specific transcription factor domain-containing protein, partial [Mycena epipterygia]
MTHTLTITSITFQLPREMYDSRIEPPVPGSKRRRMKGSCDRCKQRKIRCDSSEMPGSRCSNCIEFSSECTKNIGSSTLPSLDTPFPPDGINMTKAHVATIISSQSTAHILGVNLRRLLLDVANYAHRLELQLTSTRRSLSLPPSDSSTDSLSHPAIRDESTSEDDDLFVNGTLIKRFERFVLDSYRTRFFGKSSHVELIKTAMNAKEKFKAGTQNPQPTRRLQFWRSPWEHDDLTPTEVLPPLVFPDPDLLQNLVSIYFRHINILLCLLHRPTFEQNLAASLHFVDRQFGATVLAVCALAARYSDDPRVLLEGTNIQLSAGWKYFRQLQPIRTSLVETATLYEVQMICLCIFYLQGSSVPEPCWVLGGVAMRYAHDVGVHRRHRYDDKVLDEQWKRVFWLLICIDALGSSFCGRPRATFSDEYDLDYPVECDDEYWMHPDPEKAFKQPDGKPSAVSFTVAYLKLIEIMGMSQKTIYSVRKQNKPEEWTQSVVAELDAALNAWVDAIPEHLRWDPHREDPVFAAQSSALYACYYHVQIQVHRIFMLSSPNKVCPMTNKNYPSLAICANSARSCSHVMDVASRRGFLCTPHVLSAISDSGVVLLLNVWGGREVGLSTDPQNCLQDVETCLRILRMYETRWQSAGRQHDIITELMSATKLDWQFAPNHLKRGLELDEDYEPAVIDTITDTESWQTAGVNRVPLTQPGLSSGLSIADIDPLFTLPKYTEDLGRLPVYEPFRWTRSPTFADEYQNPATYGSNVEQVDDSLAPRTKIPVGYAWNDWGITSVEELVNALDNPGVGAHL